jgi:hypothetical protein
VHFQDFSGIAELALFVLAAFGLDLAEQNERPLELAGEALAVNSNARLCSR